MITPDILEASVGIIGNYRESGIYLKNNGKTGQELMSIIILPLGTMQFMDTV
jgi:hypothetical protein